MAGKSTDPRQAARAQAAALRQQQEAQRRRRRWIGIGVLAVALVALVGVVVYILAQSSSNALPAYDENLAPADVTTRPDIALEDGGVAVSADGVGTLDDDATRIDVYLDYMCPACGQFESVNGDTLVQLAADGDASVVYHPIAILNRFSNGTGYSTRAAAAGYLVADEAPDTFVAFTEQMFAQQPDEGTSGLTNAEIADVARDAGVPNDVAGRISDGTAVDDYGQWVTSLTNAVSADESLVAEGSSGFGTPTITIDGTVWTENWTDPNALLAAVAG